MTLLALELNDAGILAAGGEPPQLLAADEDAPESPGFALPGKNSLLTGRAAERQARLYPQQIWHRFWDQLDAAPVKRSVRRARSAREMAYAHLSRIWARLKDIGDELVITVPAFYTREQLSVLLGITQALDIPVQGLVHQAVAAVSPPLYGGTVFYLDIHLHRTSVSRLQCGDLLQHEETLTLDLGLLHLQRVWAEGVAEAFVHASRFDPLHKAASEQLLVDRLPDILARLQINPVATVELETDAAAHRISLNREALVQRCLPYYRQLSAQIDALSPSRETSRPRLLVLSHRMALLPGWVHFCSEEGGRQCTVLEQGAAAFNVLQFWDRLGPADAGTGVFFYSRRPRDTDAAALTSVPEDPEAPSRELPTHVLSGNLAYPIGQTPLQVFQSPSAAGIRVHMTASGGTDPQPACRIWREDRRIVLESTGRRSPVRVDGRPAGGRTFLELGQTVQVGTGGDAIKLIACLEPDEA